MFKCAIPIFLSEDDKLYLRSIIQKGIVEARIHRRARILLRQAGVNLKVSQMLYFMKSLVYV